MGVPLFEQTTRTINGKRVRCYIIPVWKWRGLVVRREYALKLRTKFGNINAQLVRQIRLLKERHESRDKEMIALKAQRQYNKSRVKKTIAKADRLIEQITNQLNKK